MRNQCNIANRGLKYLGEDNSSFNIECSYYVVGVRGGRAAEVVQSFRVF